MLLADTVVGVVVIVIAFWLVWTRPGWMTWGLFFYVIWMNPGQSFTYYALLQRWPIAVFAQEVAEALASGAAYAGLMIFALRFPDDRTEPRWQKVQWAALLIGVIMTGLTLAGFANMFGFPTEKITEVSFAAGLVVDAAVLLILLHAPPHAATARRAADALGDLGMCHRAADVYPGRAVPVVRPDSPSVGRLALAGFYRPAVFAQRRASVLRFAGGVAAPGGECIHSTAAWDDHNRLESGGGHTNRPAP